MALLEEKQLQYALLLIYEALVAAAAIPIPGSLVERDPHVHLLHGASADLPPARPTHLTQLPGGFNGSTTWS